MQLGGQRGDRRRRVRDRRLELRRFGGEPLERVAFDCHALAQFLDLALGRQDAARFDLAAAGDKSAPRRTSPSSVATGTSSARQLARLRRTIRR